MRSHNGHRCAGVVLFPCDPLNRRAMPLEGFNKVVWAGSVWRSAIPQGGYIHSAIDAVVAREHRKEQRFIVRGIELARWIRGKGHLGKSVAQVFDKSRLSWDEVSPSSQRSTFSAKNGPRPRWHDLGLRAAPGYRTDNLMRLKRMQNQERMMGIVPIAASR